MTESKRKGLKDLAYHVANGLFLPVENFFECFTWECITCDTFPCKTLKEILNRQK